MKIKNFFYILFTGASAIWKIYLREGIEGSSLQEIFLAASMSPSITASGISPPPWTSSPSTNLINSSLSERSKTLVTYDFSY